MTPAEFWQTAHPPERIWDLWPTIGMAGFLTGENTKGKSWPRRIWAYWPAICVFVAQFCPMAPALYILIVASTVSLKGWRWRILTAAPPLGFVYGSFKLVCGLAWLLAALLIGRVPCRFGWSGACMDDIKARVHAQHSRR